MLTRSCKRIKSGAISLRSKDLRLVARYVPDEPIGDRNLGTASVSGSTVVPGQSGGGEAKAEYQFSGKGEIYSFTVLLLFFLFSFSFHFLA